MSKIGLLEQTHDSGPWLVDVETKVVAVTAKDYYKNYD
jgi:hypothetical protein